jgi:hypothetical protein
MRWFAFTFIFFFALVPALATAGESGGDAGFDWLRTEYGARPAAMGGAFCAVPGDLHGTAFNPAGLADVRDMEGAFTFIDHLFDFRSGFIGFCKSLGRTGRLGFGVSYTHYGAFTRTDEAGNDVGSFSPADFVVSAAYADHLPMGLKYGATLKYIHSRIDQYAASALAVDLGLMMNIPSQNAHVGLSVLNLGTSIDAFVEEHEKLPLSYRLGVSKRLAHLPLLLSFNVIRYQYDESDLFWGLYWALGGEFTITENLFLRWGYHSQGREEKVGADDDRFAGFSGGIGIRYQKYQMDIGIRSHGVLGLMNNFSITIPF